MGNLSSQASSAVLSRAASSAASGGSGGGSGLGARGRHGHARDAAVDAGHAAPLGLYAAKTADHDAAAVRALVAARRLAPFYRGLGDPADDAAAAVGAAAVLPPAPHEQRSHEQLKSPSIASLTLRRRERSASVGSAYRPGSAKSRELGAPTAPARTYDYAAIYRDAVECPICFLYYPRNINYTRCCLQPICTECFVQIKRNESTMEPAECPYCVVPHFGVTYDASEFDAAAAIKDTAVKSPLSPSLLGMDKKEPLAHDPVLAELDKKDPAALLGEGEQDKKQQQPTPPPQETPAAANALPSEQPAPVQPAADDVTPRETPDAPAAPPEKRQLRKSKSHKDPGVVTTDDVRPDWRQKYEDLMISQATGRTRRWNQLTQQGQRQRQQQQQQQQQQQFSSTSTFFNLGRRAASGSTGDQVTDVALAAAALAETMGGDAGDYSAAGAGGARRAVSINVPAGNAAYYDVMRAMGGDLEDVMIMEAIRRSLREAESQERAQEAEDEELRRESQQ